MQNVRHNLTGLYGWNKKYLKHPERFTLNPLTFFFLELVRKKHIHIKITLTVIPDSFCS